MIALITIGSVIFVTVIVLVIVILVHRRKPKITFESTKNGKEIVDSVLFKKTVNPIHTEDIAPDDSKVEDVSYDIDNSHQYHSPTRMETNNVIDVD